jgi:hypothetical protein
MSIDSLKPGDLTKRVGFRSRKPDAMTNAEKQRKYRLAKGGRTINTQLTPEIAACFLYLRKEWGMETDREVMEAAVRFLTICTRKGLTKLPQELD